jgi:CubicO group peptidase (beta-lactamase class C family)
MTKLSEVKIIDLLERNNVPGISIALVEDGKLIWRREFGIKNADTRNPIDVNTVFECASLAKTLFAYAVLKYFKKENLTIDEPLENYYPHLYNKLASSCANPNLKFVTLRHILSHTSGFSNWHRLEGTHVGKLKFMPGEKFPYSGEGYIYLQRVLEYLSCYPLAQYMQKNILIPFNMINSYPLNLPHPHN